MLVPLRPARLRLPDEIPQGPLMVGSACSGRLNPQTRTAFYAFSQPFHSLRAAKCSNGIDLNHRSRIYGQEDEI